MVTYGTISFSALFAMFFQSTSESVFLEFLLKGKGAGLQHVFRRTVSNCRQAKGVSFLSRTHALHNASVMLTSYASRAFG